MKKVLAFYIGMTIVAIYMAWKDPPDAEFRETRAKNEESNEGER